MPSSSDTFMETIQPLWLPHEYFWKQAHLRRSYLVDIGKEYGKGEAILPDHILVVDQENPDWNLVFLYNPPFRERTRDCGIRTRFTGTSNTGLILGIKSARAIDDIEAKIIRASMGIFRMVVFTDGKLALLPNPQMREPSQKVLESGVSVPLHKLGNDVLKSLGIEKKDGEVVIYLYDADSLGTVTVLIEELPEIIVTRHPFLLLEVQSNKTRLVFSLDTTTHLVCCYGASSNIEARKAIASKSYDLLCYEVLGVNILTR